MYAGAADYNFEVNNLCGFHTTVLSGKYGEYLQDAEAD
jgi:hypothetical protein